MSDAFGNPCRDPRHGQLVARSCPTCHSIGPRRVVAGNSREDYLCADPWHDDDLDPHIFDDAAQVRADAIAAARATEEVGG